MFRPTFESLERREVFSGTDRVPMETMSLNVAGAADTAVAVQGGTYTVNLGPDVSQLAGDFTGDGDVDGADFLVWRSKWGLVGDSNNDIPVEANHLAAGNPTGGNPTAGANFVDALIGWDFRSRALENLNFDRMGILPYMEQDNLYKLRFSPSESNLDTAFADIGPRRILLDPEARGNFVDGTSNTIMFFKARAGGVSGASARPTACVTDLIIDPFNAG